jgi:hypothetical protein
MTELMDKSSEKSIKELPGLIITQMLTLSSSGFGVVAALAWNEVIKEIVDTYVKPYLGKGSGLISLLLYAIGVTALAVLITVQLSKVQESIKVLNEKVKVSKKTAQK